MRTFRLVAALGAALSLATPAARAQQQPAAVGDPATLQRIWAEGMERSQLVPLGQALLDSIGPRLTASPGMRAGQEWLIRKYAEWGVAARNEAYGTWMAWERGGTQVELVEPRVRALEATMLAWSPGTGGRTVTAPVVTLPESGFAEWLRTARGKFVLVSFPQPTCRPDENWEEWGLPETVERMRRERTEAQAAWSRRVQATGLNATQLEAKLDSAGVAGVIRANWSAGWGVEKVFQTNNVRSPGLLASCEDYGLLHRLASNGQDPVIRVRAESRFLGEQPVFNTIAEIRGSDLPNEYVMLSAHFDSWDAASGATDNGTGTITMMEAVRILKEVYPNPRRTILVGHWSGEEQGLNGSRAFVANHPEIVAGLQALFNQDNGTGRVTSISLQGFAGAGPVFHRWLGLVPASITRHITLAAPGTPASGGTDNASFVCAGAPAFTLSSLSWDYGTYTWHTNRDTFDKISWDDVRNNAVLTAMLAYLASEDPARVPRERATPLLNPTTGAEVGWPTCQPGVRASGRSMP